MIARTSWSAILGACIAWQLATSGAARADAAPPGPPPEAKKAFADGKAAFERGDYEAALQLFQRAILIAPAPSLYYNIGMAYERLSRYEDSAIAFEKYLELADAPQNEDEKTFQANLRARATANRDRAKRAATEPVGRPPAPLVEPPPAPPPVSPNQPPRAQYVPQPYGVYPGARYVFTAPPLTHQQRLDKATRHRNNGIALTIVGSVLTIGGAGATAWAATASAFNADALSRGLAIWGTTVPIIVGVPLLIPGAVAWGKWQGELDREKKRSDDGAAARKAALDLGAPPVALTRGVGTSAVVLSTPAISF